MPRASTTPTELARYAESIVLVWQGQSGMAAAREAEADYARFRDWLGRRGMSLPAIRACEELQQALDLCGVRMPAHVLAPAPPPEPRFPIAVIAALDLMRRGALAGTATRATGVAPADVAAAMEAIGGMAALVRFSSRGTLAAAHQLAAPERRRETIDADS